MFQMLIVSDNKTWACRKSRKGRGCNAEPYKEGHTPGHTCGETYGARWHCAISYLMEMLYNRILDGTIANTVVIPEAMDYNALIHNIQTKMEESTLRVYPDRSLWPKPPKREAHINNRKTRVSFQMREPWLVYTDLSDWMHALFRHYAPNVAPPEAGASALEIGNALMREVSENHQLNFKNQLLRWCKAAVPYFVHDKPCPSPKASIGDLIKHIEEALETFHVKPTPPPIVKPVKQTTAPTAAKKIHDTRPPIQPEKRYGLRSGGQLPG